MVFQVWGYHYKDKMVIRQSYLYNCNHILVRRPLHIGTVPRYSAWWRHQVESFSALLALCAGNSPVPGEFPSQRPVTRSFDVIFDVRLNKPLSKQSWGWWFETLSRPLWRHCNVTSYGVTGTQEVNTFCNCSTLKRQEYFHFKSCTAPSCVLSVDK